MDGDKQNKIDSGKYKVPFVINSGAEDESPQDSQSQRGRTTDKKGDTTDKENSRSRSKGKKEKKVKQTSGDKNAKQTTLQVPDPKNLDSSLGFKKKVAAPKIDSFFKNVSEKPENTEQINPSKQKAKKVKAKKYLTEAARL